MRYGTECPIDKKQWIAINVICAERGTCIEGEIENALHDYIVAMNERGAISDRAIAALEGKFDEYDYAEDFGEDVTWW